MQHSEELKNATTEAGPKPVLVRGKPVVGIESAGRHVKELSRVSPWKGVAAIAFDWLVIAVCFGVYGLFPGVWTWLILAPVIGGRQHALLILMHDAAHYRILPSHQWNDRVSNVFCSYPFLIITQGYRANHLMHHFYLNSDKDPDWTRKQKESGWSFPVSLPALFRLLIRELLGYGLYNNFKMMTDLDKNTIASPNKNAHSGKITHLVAIASIHLLAVLLSIRTGHLNELLLLWYLPFATFLPLALKVRSIARHFGLQERRPGAGDDDLKMSRNYFPSRWEKVLMIPHHIGYHLDHHLYPSVPFYNLPKLHKLLMQVPDYAARAHQNQTVFSLKRNGVVHDLTAGKVSDV